MLRRYYQYGRDPSYDVYIDKAVRQWYPRGLRAQLTPDIGWCTALRVCLLLTTRQVLYALWAAAAQGGANPPSAPVDDIVLGAQVLQDWPLDTIKYPSYNQDRWDIQLDPQWTNPLSRHALPRDEHTAMMWAHDGVSDAARSAVLTAHRLHAERWKRFLSGQPQGLSHGLLDGSLPRRDRINTARAEIVCSLLAKRLPTTPRITTLRRSVGIAL